MRPIDDLVGPTLADRLRNGTQQQHRLAAFAAAVGAVRAARVQDTLIEEALVDLTESRYGESMRGVITAVEEQFDETAWGLQDQTGDQSIEYLRAFREARAVSAVKSCFERDALVAMNEAIYEASHSVGDDHRLRQVLDAAQTIMSPENTWTMRDLVELMWPRFVELEGYALRERQAKRTDLTQWTADGRRTRAAIEDGMNHVHLEHLVAFETPPEREPELAGHLARATAWGACAPISARSWP